MSSTQLPSGPPSAKTTSNTAPAAQLPPSQTALVLNNSNSAGNDPQRRSNGGGGMGPSAVARGNSTAAAPRNGQNARKGHKNHRKPGHRGGGRGGGARYPDSDGGAAPLRKGQSITHLINWDVAAPRPQTAFGDYLRPRNARRAPTWGLGSGYHAVDKARYINSNYRFIVNPIGTYRVQAFDSDAHLQWDLVLQVLASARTQCPNCPICLSEPVAPRMAKCGHIFCLPCLVRYMAASDSSSDRPAQPEKARRSKKCVICMDNVYMNDIRPVRFVTGQEGEPPKAGDDVVLRLIMRKQGSTLALPKDGADTPSDLDEIPWHFAAEVMDYARVMKGTEDYMMEQFGREIEEVSLMEKEDELMFGEEGDWSKKAVNMIRRQMEDLKGIGNPPRSEQLELEKPKEKKHKERAPIEFLTNDKNVPAMYHVQHEAKSGHSSQLPTPPRVLESTPVSAEALASSLAQTKISAPVPVVSDTSRDDGAYFFYQALLHYYLSPLDIRILKEAFGSFSTFPSTVLPRVENVTTGHTVDDDLRKRAKYLAHLPFGCEVSFLECDWSDIVPPAILSKFQHDIDRRRRVKREKELKEERDRIRAEKLEDEQRWASTRHRRRESIKDSFLKQDDFVALPVPEQQQQQEELEWDGGRESSFASLAATSPETSPPQMRTTVWGTRVVDGGGDELLQQQPDDNSGWRTDWEKELMLEEEAMTRMSIVESRTAAHVAAGGGAGRKKKFKKVTLMTNGGKRGA